MDGGLGDADVADPVARRVIAVFLPDGSAHSGGDAVVLAGPERGGVSRAVRLTVNRWTSRVAVEVFTIDRSAQDEPRLAGGAGEGRAPAGVAP